VPIHIIKLTPEHMDTCYETERYLGIARVLYNTNFKFHVQKLQFKK